MSVKFERETYKQTEGVAGAANAAVSAATDAHQQLVGRGRPLPGTTGKHPMSEVVGTAITGGKQMAGTKGYLAVRHVTTLNPFDGALRCSGTSRRNNIRCGCH
jgi:hypothetical protein